MRKLLGVEIFGGKIIAITYFVLELTALSEQVITTGKPRTGAISVATGNNAIQLGLFSSLWSSRL